MAKTAMRPPVREAIVDAAIDALARNPGASLSAIAERAGVGRATLHRHFSSRADLLTAITRQCMDEVDAVVDEAIGDARSARDRLSRMLEALIPLGDRYHFLASERSDDTGLEARHEAECLGGAAISRRAGIYRERGAHNIMNDAIVVGLLNKLSEAGRVRRCRQANGRGGWDLTDKEFHERRDDRA